MACIKPSCKQNHLHFVVENDNAVVPGECDIGELRQLFAFFEHRAPNIESVHSHILAESLHEQTLAQMLRDNRSFVFCAHSVSTESELEKLGLAGNSLCSRCKRFLCKRSGHDSKRVPGQKETDLECLLRHIRNAIAHGHVFIIHGGNYISILFEDLNERKKITARIICCQADLKKWRAVLEEALLRQ